MSDPAPEDLQTIIRNCRLGEGCTQTWESLGRMPNPRTRFCNTCNQRVHLATDAATLWTLLKKKACVAIRDDEQTLYLGQAPGGAPYPSTDPLSWE